MKNKKPLISVIMISYNHAPYIAQAIESVLAQQTQYDFELIIGDDASPDNTQEIIKAYAKKDPRIVPSLQSKNTDRTKNFVDAVQKVRGKYVAFCEGDDFWIDPGKLEKQISFLEENPDFFVCCHKVEIYMHGEVNQKKQYVYKSCSADEERIKNGIFYADEAIANYYFQTSSVVFRWLFSERFPENLPRFAMFDHFLFMLHAVQGKIKYFDEAMSCWRRHNGGYSWLQNHDKGLFFQKEGEMWITIYKYMDNYFSYRFTWQIKERILLALRNMINNNYELAANEKNALLIHRHEDIFLEIMKEYAPLVDAYREVFSQHFEMSAPWSRNPAHKELKSAENAENILSASAPENDKKKEGRLVGGFHEFALDTIPCCKNNVWDMWTKNREYARFYNVRTGLLLWLWENSVKRLWLPDFLPLFFEKSLQKFPFPVSFYSVKRNLDIYDDFLEDVKAGEAVYTIEYLGKPLNSALVKKLAARKDIYWIHDKSQSVSCENDVPADLILYNPHMVFGVPDGGILFGSGVKNLEKYCIDERKVTDKFDMLLTKYEVPYCNEQAAYKHFESEHMMVQSPMSRTTEAMLKRIPYRDTIKQKIANWQILYEKLKAYSLWKIEKPKFAPYAFPVLVPDWFQTEIFIKLLKDNNVLAEQMWWRMIYERKNLMPVEEKLANKLVLLPCDQRYTEEDMHYIADLAVRILTDAHFITPE